MNTIVVPTDFSDYADHAVALSVELGRLTGANVDVIHAVPATDDWFFSSANDDEAVSGNDQLMNEAKARLQEIEDTPAYEDVALTTHLYNETIHQAILEHVNDQQADILIMGTHGRSGFSKYFLGATTQKVMRLVNCPVVTTKGVTRIADLQKLLFVSDFEEDVAGVFRQIKTITTSIGGSVDILTVLTPLAEADQPVNTDHFANIDKNEYQNAYILHIHPYQTLEDGVLAFANDNGYGAIALGTHARRGVKQLLHWESIAENLANHSSYPVITSRI